MKRMLLMLSIIVCVVFSACSDNSVANGTGSNAGETELAIITVKNDGAPVAARVRLWNIEKDSLSLALEGVASKNGEFEVARKELEKRIVQVQGDSLAGMQYLASAQDQVEIKIAKTVNAVGRISENGKPVANAVVRVFDKSVKTDEEGNFVVENVPQGALFAYVKANEKNMAVVVTGDSPSAIELTKEPFILVENFDDWSSRRTLLGKMFGQGWWFVSTDSLAGGNSKALNNLWEDDIIVSGDEAFNGSSFHEKFDIDSTFEYPYASAGFALGDDYHEEEMPSFYDLRGMSGISFVAKGSGSVFVQLTCKNSNGEQVYYDSKKVKLTDEWARITIAASEFDSEDEAFTLQHVNSINFVTTEDSEIYLDNIGIAGISITDWPLLGHVF